MLQVTLNGKAYKYGKGLSVLQALRSVGIEVPSLCFDERLNPSGACRLCMVQVKGFAHLVPACTTRLADGMVIDTHTPVLESFRRTLLTLLAERYPADPVQRFPDKVFHRYLREYGLEDKALGEANPRLVDDTHPYIRVDMSQCIYCFRCVHICEELQGQFVWQIWNRGHETRIVPDSGTTLRESSCVSCGACVDTCPTGALEDKSILSLGTATNWTKTTCAYCGTGCEMNVGTLDGRIVSIRPADEAPVNKGHLCVKGRYAYEYTYASDRIEKPMIRDGARWRIVSWNEAIAFAASELSRLLKQYGPQSVGVLGSSRATNEENYLAQKFARVVLGTNNVDCCARVCHAPSAAAMKLILGTGAATNSFDDIENTRTLLICGANPTENHPIVGARIKQAVLHGARLIVIDPRQIELARYADCHLQIRPGTNVALLNSMAATIVGEKLFDESFLRERVAEWEEFQDFIRQWSPEQVADACGVEAALIRKAARLYATEKPAISFHGLGLTEHTQGTEGVMCLVNLALMTGNLGRPGTGVNPLRGQNNVQGAAHMGCEPDHLTGYIPITDGKNRFDSLWGAPVPTAKGLNLLQMMDAAEGGRLKALWSIGYDVALTNANAHATKRALQSLELVIIQDLFLNETASAFGSVFLPAASSFEKDGTFMNAERRIQRVRKVVEPVGESKPDWEIICALARALGKGEFFNFHSAEEIWNEARAVWPAGQGITYGRIERGGLQWPCPTKAHPGTRVLHGESFPIGKRAALRRVDYRPTAEAVSDDFPFLLMTGRNLYQFNAGTMTLRTKNTELSPTDFLDISSNDAQQLGLQNGERVKIQSRYGEALLPVRLSASVKPGELFATFHAPSVFVNHVTGPYRDGYVDAPEYKVTAVRIEQI